MQSKTTLLTLAVVAGLAGLAVYGSRPNTDAASAADAQGRAVAAPASPAHSAQALAAAARNTVALRALIDTSARAGSQQAWASSSPEQADRTAAAERARGLLAGAAAGEVHLAQADGFHARDVMIDRDGTEHVRMERSYEGLPVIGADMVVHSRNGELLSVTQGGNLRTTARPQLKPGIAAAQARSAAGAQFDGRVAELDPAKLVVYARNGMDPTLAYQVGLRGERNDSQAPGVMSYFIDARDGRLLEAEDHVEAAAANGTGKTLTLGDVGLVSNSVSGGYELTDPSRGSGQTLDAQNYSFTFLGKIVKDADNVWGNNTTSDRATAAADAHYGVSATWDYYKTVHGRNGIKNDGLGVKSYVHYGKNYFNAAWDGTNMIYGDGDASNGNLPLVALDVAGHEMTHGVTGATAKLGYYNIKDTGGLNEATSDIFGTLVEYSIGSAADPGDFLVGEKLNFRPKGPGTQALPLRVMFQQNLDIAFRTSPSVKCYPVGGFPAADTAEGKKYDPHLTSGVANLAFYLISQGSVVPADYSASLTPADLACNGDTSVAGIGPAKAGAIWYRALTKYFVSSTDYPGARTGSLQATADLYGADSAEYKTVARAWSAVNVN
ncbi:MULTISPECIES: M4 family metallopeptidase [unclassified Lysobacter]|uniref:M4 family metallopeptidase n=1 Tax=unclassified Lysobacter TaxID=2635362 RepID=UPI001BE689DC|nr:MULTISPECIES: M4 family metallopeptidase [unclassified Lysobacter]MBT2746995.1 M4 family metallopeptidase [Lysobacter sp. ISL-42]MBT2750543.1 M4 family metallopeptidase [Lysobacter sp. ISL-50]MBT2776390.1 M4 family metallopeptidase [Lysobacter sp. ISL-54]MBT2780884.1 M4 family metallopeptidase [Lysobacter sp. ISL-52]